MDARDAPESASTGEEVRIGETSATFVSKIHASPLVARLFPMMATQHAGEAPRKHRSPFRTGAIDIRHRFW